MATPLSWDDLPGRRVGIYGLGVEGQANARACLERGVTPVLVDDAPHDATVLATNAGGLDALLHCDVVIKAPGISPYADTGERLADSSVTLTSGMNLWMNGADRRRVIGVTGTKGKSTTTSLIRHLIERCGRSCAMGGNIGIVPWDPDTATSADFTVVEVSSYQAQALEQGPRVVAVTSLHPDHLPWHGGLEAYYRDKLSLCSKPGVDTVIANGDSPELRARLATLGSRVTWIDVAHGERQHWLDALPLPGEHNRRNALIAHAVVTSLGLDADLTDADLSAAAASYHPLPHRLERVRELHGVTFIEDCLSTNVLPTIAAVEAFPDTRVALIVGGQDRGIDYADLGAFLARAPNVGLVLGTPNSGRHIIDTVAPYVAGSGTLVRACASLEEAVIAGYEWGRHGGGIVLLSPAAPSFGTYANYEEKAAAFATAVRRLDPTQ